MRKVRNEDVITRVNKAAYDARGCGTFKKNVMRSNGVFEKTCKNRSDREKEKLGNTLDAGSYKQHGKNLHRTE